MGINGSLKLEPYQKKLKRKGQKGDKDWEFVASNFVENTKPFTVK